MMMKSDLYQIKNFVGFL